MKYFPLIWAGVWRRPGRTVLTLLSIINAFLLYGLLQGFAAGLSHAQAEAHADILFSVSRVSGAEMLPASLIDRFKAVPGVVAVAPILSFAGFYQHPNQPIRAYASDPREIPMTTPAMRISQGSVEALRSHRTGMIVSEELMERYGWKVGDRVPLTSNRWINNSGGRSWAFDIVGTFRAPSSLLLRNSLIFSYEYLDQSRTKDNGLTNVIVVRVADPLRAEAVGAALDRLTSNSPYETKTEPESQAARDAVQGIGDVGALVNSVVGAVFFTLLFSVGGVMSESMRERTREVGVLKAIGFSDRAALALVLLETTLVCSCAAVLGLAIAHLLFPLAAGLIGFTAVQQGPVLLEALVLAIALALVSALPPAVRALRLPITEALAHFP